MIKTDHLPAAPGAVLVLLLVAISIDVVVNNGSN